MCLVFWSGVASQCSLGAIESLSSLCRNDPRAPEYIRVGLQADLVRHAMCADEQHDQEREVVQVI